MLDTVLIGAVLALCPNLGLQGLVRVANEYASGALGKPTPPGVDARIVGKMGFRNVKVRPAPAMGRWRRQTVKPAGRGARVSLGAINR